MSNAATQHGLFRRILAPIVCLAFVVILASLTLSDHSTSRGAVAQGRQRTVDPAGWGRDHVGDAIPEFVSGDECLFCHREDIGISWSKNHHASTIRRIEPQSDALRALRQSPERSQFAKQASFVVGRRNRHRFLKRLPAYGQLAILTAGWTPAKDGAPGRLVDSDSPHWQNETFGKSCAGCHATGVDAKTRSFSALSLDCFVCHGDASLDHTNDSSMIHLAKKRSDDPRVIISICAQCHVRSGESRSTGRRYPNNFVAGDNLFRDFQVDFSDEHLASLNPADRHILENIRDVAVYGEQRVTCLSCHRVHGQSSERHHRVAQSKICLNCHDLNRPKSEQKPYEVHSRTCGY